MGVIEIIIISSLTTATGFFFKDYLHNLLKEKSQSKSELEQNKRESLKKLLDLHAELLIHKFENPNWLDSFSEMSRNIILWGSDNIISEYGEYVKKHSSKEFKEILEQEIHFAKAILAFRKELGYKNKKNKVTPEHIILIFRSGQKYNI